MATSIELRGGVTIPASEIDVEYARSGGPGGQHVNKTETRVTLRFSIPDSSVPDRVKQKLLTRLATRLTKNGELLVSAEAHRERQRNLGEAYERMKGLLDGALVEKKKRRKTKPTAGSKARRLKEKKQTSDKKRARKQPARDD